MKKISLRDYQKDMVAQIQKEFEQHYAVLVQMPTGTGKTVVIASLCERMENGKWKIENSTGTIWIVTHRREIVEQIERTLDRFGIDRERVKVYSIQKLRRPTPATDNSPSLIIIDEAHHSLAPTYRMLWERFPKAKKLGVTATPWRMNGESFSGLYDTFISSWSIKRFIEEGYLADYDYYVVTPDSDMRKRIATLKKRAVDGDYQVKEMGGVLDNRASVSALYASFESCDKLRTNSKGIVYAINIDHAEHIAEYYRCKGIKAMAISAKTPKVVREEMVKDFREGRIDCLVNVDIFSEGFDCPDAQYIQLARPTLSLTKFMQQIGRGLRPNKDGSHTIILDCVGSYYLFGLPEEVREAQRPAPVPPREGAYHHAAYAIRPQSTGVDVEMGHSLEMMLVHERELAKRELGDDVTFKTINRFGIRGMFRNGKRLGSAEFSSYGKFLGGVVRLQNNNYPGGMYCNYEGRFLAGYENGSSKLLKNGFIERKDEQGALVYYDTKMQAQTSHLPIIYKKGGGEFVVEADGLHVRLRQYCHIPFKKERICLKNGFCIATDASDRRFVIYDQGWQMMQLIEERIDGTFVCRKEGFNNTIFLARDGKVRSINKREVRDCNY